MIIAICGAALCAFAVIYPYAIYPLILRLCPTRPVHPRADFQPQVSLFFCAYNEARAMPDKLENIAMLKEKYPNLEVLAFDDGSSDATASLIAARPGLVRLFRGGGRNGKAYGMKLMAKEAKGEILVFTDANVTLEQNAVARIAAYFGDPAIGGVCGSLHYQGADGSLTAAVGSSYWRLEEYIKAEESRTGNVMGADGSIFALRKSLYPAFPDTVLDDMTVSMAAIFSGHRLIKVEDVIAYESLVAQRKDEFSRKVRISARAFHTHLFLRKQLRRMPYFDRFKYLSHRLVRWFGGFELSLGAAFFAIALWLVSPWLLLAGAAVFLAAMFAALRANSGLLATITEIVAALMATALGIMKAMRGQTVVVWTPPQSR